jgi:hypothetical protein
MALGFGPLVILGPLARAVVGAAEGAVGTGRVGGAGPRSQEEVARAQEVLRNAGSIEVSQHDHQQAAVVRGSSA